MIFHHNMMYIHHIQAYYTYTNYWFWLVVVLRYQNFVIVFMEAPTAQLGNTLHKQSKGQGFESYQVPKKEKSEFFSLNWLYHFADALVMAPQTCMSTCPLIFWLIYELHS